MSLKRTLSTDSLLHQLPKFLSDLLDPVIARTDMRKNINCLRGLMPTVIAEMETTKHENASIGWCCGRADRLVRVRMSFAHP